MKTTSKIIHPLNSALQFKIVYWGPGESGKTTSYNILKRELNSKRISKSLSIETTDGRTLWKDSMYLQFTFKINDTLLTIFIQIVTCTGQERFLSTREYVLDGADGIVFVADSDPKKREENKRSYRELMSFTSSKAIHYVIQLNKRDLEDAIPIDQFKKDLGLPEEEKYPDGTLVIYPSIALEGKNILLCFKDLIGRVLFNVLK